MPFHRTPSWGINFWWNKTTNITQDVYYNTQTRFLIVFCLYTACRWKKNPEDTEIFQWRCSWVMWPSFISCRLGFFLVAGSCLLYLDETTKYGFASQLHHNLNQMKQQGALITVIYCQAFLKAGQFLIQRWLGGSTGDKSGHDFVLWLWVWRWVCVWLRLSGCDRQVSESGPWTPNTWKDLQTQTVFESCGITQLLPMGTNITMSMTRPSGMHSWLE